MKQYIQQHSTAFFAALVWVAAFTLTAIIPHAYSMTPETQISNYKPPITGTKVDQYTAFPKRRLVIVTKQGTIKLQMFEKIAPKHVAHFTALANSHFFDGTTFHRVIPGFMIQGGDPNSKDTDLSNDGMGQPGQETIQAEFSNIHHAPGILSTARKGNDVNSASSQFFIMVADYGSLDRQYTVWGQVIDGMDVVEKIVALPKIMGDNPGKASEILKMYVEND
ncbi:MAG TPA: peptidylprolyl isomerase [Candidatus Kapabacteria bacterium]|nr:peptidylprolyl isomerase [Candidatus Kapabacteria bacterium]